VRQLSSVPLLGRFLALPANIILGLERPARENTNLLQAFINLGCKVLYYWALIKLILNAKVRRLYS